jgi:lipopolysaccharide/colanic/teichoic acid biosynthesis glycosyltransferase
MLQVLSSRLSPHQIGSVVALALRPVRLTGTQAVAKRAFGVIAASLLLLVTLPLSVGSAIAIHLTSPGPVFFHQERVTKGGRTFLMHKFRTMSLGAWDASDVDTSAPFFKVDQDPRITHRDRHLLRKWSLDELPQIWNVVCGER